MIDTGWGLFHVGLARWGADTVVGEGLALTVLPTTAVLQRLLVDLDNIVLDGKDGLEQVVYATTSEITTLRTNTLRFDLAQSIVRWLDATEVTTSVPGNNPTGLTTSLFDSPTGFLWRISDNTSELFGPEPPVAFDQSGPALLTLEITPSVSDVPPVHRDNIAVQVEAQDPSDVFSIGIEIDNDPGGAVGVDAFPGLPGQSLVQIDTTLVPDGPQTVTVTATDTLGNTSIQTVDIIVDNTPPQLSLTGPTLVPSGPYSVVGTTSDAATAVELLEVSVGGSPASSLNDPPSSFMVPTSLPCNQASQVEVRATDRAGNTTVQSQVVSCDAFAPTLAQQPSQYVPAGDLTLSHSSDGSLITYAGTNSVLLQTVSWSASSPVTIQKYFNRLESRPFRRPR